MLVSGVGVLVNVTVQELAHSQLLEKCTGGEIWGADYTYPKSSHSKERKSSKIPRADSRGLFISRRPSLQENLQRPDLCNLEDEPRSHAAGVLLFIFKLKLVALLLPDQLFVNLNLQVLIFF